MSSIKLNFDNVIKVVATGALLILALSGLIYSVRGPKSKTNYQFCYDECIKMGVPPKNGSCDDRHYLGTRTASKGPYSKGDPWCYNNNGVCLALCKDK